MSRVCSVRAEPVEARTVFEALSSSAKILEAARVPRPRWTAEQLLSRRLGCSPVELYLDGQGAPSLRGGPPSLPLGTGSGADEAISFQADVAARASGVPLQYLQGSADFYGREFLVGPGVFIPRPETEVLIDVTLDLLTHSPILPFSHSPVLIDVGAGSGAIAVTLALERPGLKVIGTDLSASALSFARRNAQWLEAPVTFVRGSLLDSFAPRSVDWIVANLPYLNPRRVHTWPRELHWEPWIALDGGEEGLSLIEELVQQAFSVLRPGGRLVLEIGHGQADPVRQFAQPHGLSFEQLVHDLAGLERMVIFSRGLHAEEVC